MPAVVRLSKKELIDLIEETEAAGVDATEFRGLLAEVEEEEQLEKPARPAIPLRAGMEETTEERLIRETAYLFPQGISSSMMEQLIEYDLKYSLEELRQMCVEAGLSPGGHKKLLAAKLLAHQRQG